ncbi:MAG: hypothetical protein M3336_00515 [Chloroflexota bacterium]|nr:hypothetical protein [Chloroflexota bacterium]
MPGTPTRTFELEIAPLLPKAPTGVPGEEIAPRLNDLLVAKRLEALFNRAIVPLGLRWRVTPTLGLPRAPFSVWRRDRRRGDPIDVHFSTDAVAGFHLGGGKFHVPAGPLYVLQIGIRNIHPTAAVTVSALDLADRPLPLQSVVVPANTLRFVRFQHPFMGGFSCRGGSFIIASVDGVTMKAWIERQDEWELIDVAGLPANAGEIDGYGPGQQGEPTQPQSPPDAALRRLAIGQQFYEDLPTMLPSGVTVPVWEVPKPDEAVEEVRGGSPSLVQRLDDMFRAVDTRAVANQAAFRALETVPGVRQPEVPGQATEDALMTVPLLASVLLNAVTDPWFALASGFGTTDFPEFLARSERFVEPASYFNVSHDYMVSSTFTFRLFDTLEFKREHCALSHRSAFPPVPPGQLAAAPFALNRPPQRDDPWSAEVSLTWAKVNRLQIQGNAMAVADSAASGDYLNALRPATQTGKRALLVPAKPGQTSDPILQTRNRFFHHGAELPFAGVRTFRYGVAAMDAFGRWSAWSAVQQDLAARPPEAPRLMALALTPDTTRATGNAVPHELSFEVLWDWQDRSPKRFQLAGVFHARHTLSDGTTDNGHIPPSVYPAIFQTDNTVASGPLLELTFPSDSPPNAAPRFDAIPTASDARATIELLPQATNANGQNVEGQMRRYRVRLADLNVSFAPDEEWFYSLYVKAAEWRNPGLLSDDSAPLPPGRPPRLTSYVPNPIPPPPPVFVPATVLWASLPDAQDVSRFRLAFERVPSAMGGYAIYQAYEAKLRQLAGLPAANGVDLVARATELRDLAMPLARCADAFSRLNAKLVAQPAGGAQVEFEVELPGTLDGIVALAVTSVTREQEASPLSQPWLFVAVPRRAVPATPALTAAEGQDGTITLTCDFARAPKPARVEILRVRREYAARDAGTMGRPLHESEPSTWQPLDEQGRPATSAADTARFRFSLADSVPRSWFPYFYRAVAIGAADDTTGLVPGRSLQSNLVRVEQLPRSVPTIDAVQGEQTGPQQITVAFRSDAAIETTPHGSFLLQVSEYDFVQARFAEQPALGVLLPLVQPRPANGALLPGVLYASQSDPTSARTFQFVVDVIGDRFLIRLRLTDPLGRTSERLVGGNMQASAAPDLQDLRMRRELRDLFLRFRSSTPTEKPPSGEYRLRISFLRSASPGTQLLLTAALHEIRVGDLNLLRASPVSAILRSASSPPSQPAEYGAVIKRFFPPGPFLPPPEGLVRVTLSAPDGTVTRAESEI